MIPLVAPTITRRDRDYLAHACYNGLLDTENEVRKFERAFAAYVGCVDAVAVCSGTAALRLATEATIVNTSIPTYACTALLHGTNADRFVDSTWDVLTARMRQNPATVLVHMFGNPTSTVFASPVEDWTLSLGGIPELRGRVGVCSTHASKMISTGRGGLVFSDDQNLIQHIRQHAADSGVGMSAQQAALGNSQLAQLPSFVIRRRDIAAHYTSIFRAAGIECPDADCGSVFFRYLIDVTDPGRAVRKLESLGVEAGRGVYPPLHQIRGLSDTDFPGAANSVNRLLSVPCHPSITDRQSRYIAEQVVEVCAR